MTCPCGPRNLSSRTKTELENGVFQASQSSRPSLKGLTSSQRGGRSACSIALVCTTRRRVPASISTDQGPEQVDSIQIKGLKMSI